MKSPQLSPNRGSEQSARIAAAEARWHAIHGAPSTDEPAADKAPRKAGWWSRRKTG
jgi:hypothetical protein